VEGYICGVIKLKTKTTQHMASRDPKSGRFLKSETSTKTKTAPKTAPKAKPSPLKKSKPASEPAPKAKAPKATKAAKPVKAAKAEKVIKETKPKAVKASKAVVEKAAKEIREKVMKVLETPLQVFIKKDISGNPKNIGPGSSVIFEKLSVIGPTGSNVFRVKRENSDRTYYTTAENIPQ
jgi:hypothetical protein